MFYVHHGCFSFFCERSCLRSQWWKDLFSTNNMIPWQVVLSLWLCHPRPVVLYEIHWTGVWQHWLVVDRDPTVRAVSSVDIEVQLTIQPFDVTMCARMCFCCFCQFLAAATCFVFFFFFVFVFFFALFASIDAGCLVRLVRCYVSLLFASNRSISMLVSSHRLCCLLLLLCYYHCMLLSSFWFGSVACRLWSHCCQGGRCGVYKSSSTMLCHMPAFVSVGFFLFHSFLLLLLLLLCQLFHSQVVILFRFALSLLRWHLCTLSHWQSCATQTVCPSLLLFKSSYRLSNIIIMFDCCLNTIGFLLCCRNGHGLWQN